MGKGGSTGLELTGELADLIMLWWDEDFLGQLKNLSVEIGLYTHFKDDFTVKLKNSGYSVKDRKEIIVNAKKIFQLQCERDEKGIKPLFRPREMILTDRKNKKGQKHSWWKVKDKYNAVMFVPPTPGGVLLKILRARAENISADPDLKIRFIEQGSVKIKNLLVKANPFPTADCIDALCPICKKTSVSEPGDKPIFRAPCSTEGVGYRIVCINCKEQGKLSSYEGETGRPAKVRFIEHIKKLNKKSELSPLHKHQSSQHPKDPNRWHFSITSVFKDPLTRQVDEAVRISRLPPESILNSKSEINHAPLNRISIKK